MVLDLEAQVPAHDVEQAPPGDVARPEHLAEVPVTLGLALTLGFGELEHAAREMPAENDDEGPQVADQVGQGVGGQGQEEERSGERRPHDVVPEGQPCRLFQAGP